MVGTDRQEIVIIEGVRLESIDDDTIRKDGDKRIGIGVRALERQEVLLCGTILSGDIDSMLPRSCDRIQDGLRALLLYRIYLRHVGLTDRQMDEVVVAIRCETI